MTANTPMVDWNDRNLGILRRGVADGKSYTEIAKEIGPGVTRNAALGKAHRLGWAQPRSAAEFNMRYGSRGVQWASLGGVAQVKAFEDEHARQQREKKEAKIRALRARHRATPAPAKVVISTGPIDVTNAKPWMDRGSRECAWPIEINGETYSCCAKVDAGAPAQYCGPHLTLRHQPQKPGQRKFTIRDLERSLRRYAHG